MKRPRVSVLTLSTILTVFLLSQRVFAAIGGYVLDFDGDDDYVYIGPNIDTALPTQGTVEAWVKVEASSHEMYTVVRRTTMVRSNYTLRIREGHARFGIKPDIPNEDFVEDSSILDLDRWYHLAGTFTESELNLYVNGELVDTAPLTFAPPTDGETAIGVSAMSYIRPMDGLIDDVRLWDYARSKEEIQYSMTNDLTGTESGLVAWWNFDTGSGQIAYDFSMNGNHGTLGASLAVEGTDPVWVQIPEPGLMLCGITALLIRLIGYRRR